jgi:hypothetical protein
MEIIGSEIGGIGINCKDWWELEGNDEQVLWGSECREIK